MTTLFIRSPFIATAARAHRHAFSLVEVTLAMGIVTFALVAVVGVMPVALSSGRQSANENRAAAIANTLFSSFRSQSFSSVGYVDEQFSDDGVGQSTSSNNPRLNLNLAQPDGSGNEVTFYAAFIDVATDAGAQADTFGDQRRLCFTKSAQALPPNGTPYQVALHFNNRPDGMVIDPATTGTTPIAQANQVEVVITPANQALKSTNQQILDRYRFVSTIANREH